VPESSSSVYQTGQTVPSDGTYAVVGVQVITVEKQECAIRELDEGAVFPSYEGWDVCWRLVTAERSRKPQIHLAHR
jgi:hypothetical protein